MRMRSSKCILPSAKQALLMLVDSTATTTPPIPPTIIHFTNSEKTEHHHSLQATLCDPEAFLRVHWSFPHASRAFRPASKLTSAADSNRSHTFAAASPAPIPGRYPLLLGSSLLPQPHEAPQSGFVAFQPLWSPKKP